ncbi:hypothetical protein [Massilia sp. TN1-12]|uniref:hypothetical protein n=1 Tax=Massilia paldalensis TaxID=3377675 RepID=UPI00384E6B5A
MAKTPPKHYIAFPDKSWIDAEGYDQYPAEHRMKLAGCACILENDWKQSAYRDDKFWNPVTIGMRVELPKNHFIVWRTNWDGDNVNTAFAQDKHQFAAKAKHSPNHMIGAACVRAISIAQAERIAQESSFWNPVDEKIIDQAQEDIRQERAARRNHYPEAW